MLRWIWKHVALFAYRRWAKGQPVTRKPTGIPHHRDPDAPCSAYAPRSWQPGDFRDCQTDGHYLCKECCHRAPDADPDRA